MSRKLAHGSLALLAVLLVSGAAMAREGEGEGDDDLASSRSQRVSEASETRRPSTLGEILERASRWVISIRVERTKDLPRGPGLGPGLPRAAIPKEMQSYYERPKGWVSGLLLDADGLAMTSLYNVGGEVKSIEVALPSGEVVPAKAIGTSPADDVALLRVELPETWDAEAFTPPEWARGSTLRPGQFVLAVGRSPDPGRVTVTRGILSAVSRNGDRTIQTDAELNYGNVGGPLLDLDGRVVAIAGFIGHDRPQWGVNSGVGFGTKASTLVAMLPKLAEGGTYVAFQIPFLGVRGAVKFVGPRGAKIEQVVAGGPAGKAGILGGDRIVEFAGAEVESFEQLRRLIFARRVGETIKVKVVRDEATREFELTLGEMRS